MACGALALQAVLAPALAVESAATPDWSLSLGPAVEVTPAYPGASASRTFVLPDIEAQYGDWLYISGTDLLGIYAYNRETTKAGAALEYDFTQRLSSDSVRVRNLEDVKTTPRFKLFVERRVAIFNGGVNVATDIGGHGEGTIAQAHVELLLPLTSHGFVTVGPGATWSDTQYMAAFFGVTPEQSARSGLVPYRARAGISDVYVEAVMGYEISRRWAIGLDATVARLVSRAAHSPFTESTRQATILASVTYKVR